MPTSQDTEENLSDVEQATRQRVPANPKQFFPVAEHGTCFVGAGFQPSKFFQNSATPGGLLFFVAELGTSFVAARLNPTKFFQNSATHAARAATVAEHGTCSVSFSGSIAGNRDGCPTSRILRHLARPGFTLVELLVSMAILILLVAILAGIFSSVSKTSQLGYANNERMQNILAITDFIRTDLRSALLPVNRTDTNNLQFVVNPGSIGTAYKNPHAIFWQAPTATDQTLGDVAEVGYFVQWTTSNRPYLCRFSAENSTNAANFLIYSQPAAWLTDAIIKNVAPADEANAYQGLIAENVVALFVQCLDKNGQPITRNAAGNPFANAVFDSRQGFLSSTNTNAACALPPIVSLGFVLIDSRSANRIGTAEQTALKGLYASATNAADFVAAALTSPQLKAVSQGLRPYQIEVNLMNAR
jgi:uncharacterized protein (TIGR02599 family)